MNSQSECRNKCWMIAGIVGLLVLIILWLIAGVGFFGALMWAIIVGLMVGFVLPFFRCAEEDAARAPAPGAASDGAVVENAEEQRQQAEAAAKEQRAAEARAARKAAEAKADEADAARRADEEAAAAARQADADAARAAEEEAARNAAEAERQANADAARRAEEEAAREAQEAAVARQAEVPAPAAAPTAPVDHGGGGVVESAGDGTRPPALSEARGGAADDLKKIKGVGPKLEGDLNALGFYHYDQIAAWSAGEVAWADENLGGIAGRVSRDGWVEQARLLAAGGETAFSRKVDEGDVY